MPTEEEIKQLAYIIWEWQGRPQGEDKKHYYTAKRILETRERSTKMPSKKMLIVDDKLIDKLDQNRGDVSRAEFLEFCLDRCLEDIQGEGTRSEEKRAVEQELPARAREETAYATRKDFQDLKRSVKDLITAYIDIVTEQRPETRTGGVTQQDLEQLKSRLRAIVGES